MPFAVFLLALAVFAQGTSEFMLSGLLPELAADLGIPVPAAGDLTSAFALGMIAGAPLMAVLALRISRRFALTLFLAVFAAAHVVGAVTASYPLLLVTRVVAAVADAGFLAVALATAGALVAPDARGRATSVLLGGVTLACVAGVPLGAVLGSHLGWRSVFWAVALLCLPPLAAIPLTVPGGRSSGAAPWRQFTVLGRVRLLHALLLGALVNGATFCAFTYLAVFAEGTGVWVPALLALFGLGSFAGVALSARLSRLWPLLPVGWTLLALLGGEPVALIALVPVTAALSFGVGASLIARVMSLTGDAPLLGGALATAALNVGAAAGPWLGGLALGAGGGPVWVSAGLAAGAVVVWVTYGTRRGRPSRSGGSAGGPGRTPSRR
ncbi:chloramphenicol resistance protein [Actinorhabdospora filicis]|uniref:Chloramphenicol resistance protein n=1 Tax=Actinorhabdospora filicis TaxID=1785913 RepID=A0A9W6SKX4_9ACTN|nr:Cmx/CmrA family chloramphenicol efflux MFS transporter [Actinorhabdospora filicis]GLZ77817.1 chloramphenicol resistance protein [Actinorhabdospora filicis]